MSTRKPYPQLPAKLGPEWEPLRGWLVWAAQKLGLLPSALRATKVWDPGSLADGTATSTHLSVPGARKGDPVSVGFSSPLFAGMFTSGAVTDNQGTVQVTLGNLQAGTQNLGRGTLTVVVWRVD